MQLTCLSDSVNCHQFKRHFGKAITGCNTNIITISLQISKERRWQISQIYIDWEISNILSYITGINRDRYTAGPVVVIPRTSTTNDSKVIKRRSVCSYYIWLLNQENYFATIMSKCPATCHGVVTAHSQSTTR